MRFKSLVVHENPGTNDAEYYLLLGVKTLLVWLYQISCKDYAASLIWSNTEGMTQGSSP